MPKWEYCFIDDVFISYWTSIEKDKFFYEKSFWVEGGDHPKLLFFSKTRVKRIEFTPVHAAYKEFTLVDKLNEVIQLLNNLFPDFIIDKKQAFNDYFPEIKDISTEFEKGRWDKRYVELLATITIMYLLNSSWELMDKDGLWFKRQSN